jgi:predicted solute-binding protein
MLAAADAALIIGDPALRVDPAALTHRWLDLGVEWWELTGLPMVFAIWAARPGFASRELAVAFADSLSFGLEHFDEIVRHEAAGIRRNGGSRLHNP